jgi:CDP-glucose 4,6-dehydratase
MKRTLITGINGFLANRLIDFSGENVFGISRSDNHKTGEKRCPIYYGDILDLEFLKRVISDLEIEVIYHCAAQSIVRIANTNPRYCFEDNVMGTVNILEAVRQVNPKIKVVCASSDKAYGEHITLPYLEDMALQSGDPYSTSKACGDLVAQSYHKSYGLDVNIVRSANIYGGDMNLSRLIPNTINKILKGEQPEIYSGVMEFKREFIFVDDVCRAYNVIAEKGKPGEAYNVGTGEVYKVGDLIKEICNIMGWEGGIKIKEKSFTEITTQYLSSEKIKELGWEHEIDINLGLEKTIEFYKNRTKELVRI